MADMTAAPTAELPRIVIDGTEASHDQLRATALSRYGHFTAMQVRKRQVRGLGLHLARLDGANRELFAGPLDGGLIRDHIRHALGDDIADASVRVTVVESPAGPAVIVTVRPPAAAPDSAWRLRSVPYQRSVAHIKHADDFGQAYYQRLVQASGYDEALLTGPDGLISEGSITNVGFFDGTQVTWPAAPALAGITMQLVEPRLAGLGVPCRRSHVRLQDLPGCAAAFVTNSRGIAAVSRVDELDLPVDQRLMGVLATAYESAGWDDI
jgi:branched-subunit amino acid aminotransferase/4-amino-4-deoxychorismate lyase